MLSLARAEYRAYELAIEDVEKGTVRKEIAVLDHLQFKTFYVVKNNEKVSLLSTWRCRGNTGSFKPICPRPEAEDQRK